MKMYERIRARRKELGMTQDELAQRLGYKTRSTITRIESGENDIVQSKIAAFARALNVSIAYLLDGTDQPPQQSPQLTSDEQELVGNYRCLDDERKARLRGMAQLLKYETKN